MSDKLKKAAEYWINCNVWDSEDRGGSSDYAIFSPDNLLKLFNDFIDDEMEGYKLVPKQINMNSKLADTLADVMDYPTYTDATNIQSVWSHLLEAVDEED